MRAVTDLAGLSEAFERCRSEARRAFGDDSVYVEELMPRAKHLEVQILGDGMGQVVSLGERECSIQRRHQKLVEWAPSPVLNSHQRDALSRAAVALMAPLEYRGLGTVEFLVDPDTLAAGAEFTFVFIEVNPRLQVEHTVTEQVTGLDLVASQLRVAVGESLDDLSLEGGSSPVQDTFAIQARVNAEHTVGAVTTAATGTVTDFVVPAEARVDTYARPGLVVDGTFDSLLAKVVTRTQGSFAEAAADAVSALSELVISGVDTNVDLLRSVLTHEEFISGQATTSFLDEHESVSGQFEAAGDPSQVTAAFAAAVVSVDVRPGQAIGPGTALVTLESMKMEHPLTAGVSGTVDQVRVAVGDQVRVGQVIAEITVHAGNYGEEELSDQVDLDYVRPDLEELLRRRAAVTDEARPEAMAKRHRTGHRSARENISALVDDDSFLEFGALPVAAQRSRRDMQDLIARTPGDGIVTGLAKINGAEFGSEVSEAAVLAYDYTVLAGTQGYFNHKKTDRILSIAKQKKVPIVFFAEGGGGRPGDTDVNHVLGSGLNVTTFTMMGSLSGVVPTIGVLTGRCFAGNAALLGCCDVIIGTRDSNLGMAGPAMIEGGGLGRFTPEEVGPMDVQGPNGVVDIVVEDDEEAVLAAQRYLSYFQGPVSQWSFSDQRRLRHLIPENRKAIYNIREVIDNLVDEGSVLELRREFGIGAVTALVRVEGKPMGLVANNPAHLGGAIDSEAADKMARFLQLCDAHGLPVVSLCDTPGFMVGPESEGTATVRHFSRLFVISAHLRIPMITVILRKGYGLGAQAMAAGGFLEPLTTIAWPTGEFGPMGLEGAVQLAYSKELAAIADDGERDRRYRQHLDELYDAGKAINSAMKQDFDEVIDPAETRRWVASTLRSFPTYEGEATRYVDTW
ncbi:acetyl-CoA carboxylase carboxyltransferase component/biotin carboxyl carrier protein [Janibacter cremeus]|uniref:Acetyl-CoA carboxylase carboxyltransferase component/biotin carboxyl carrier protein n=2 Tax=Janibacter cremeus TaxID=1285192 RepID=A0A852VNG2_9MICO|nr:acetyl-CoA carboxylase carboxyltransferase component/biotin carboxyl carrier protein [Janibacter cremeus]